MYDSRQKWEKSIYNILKYGYFSYKKHMDLLQEAFIHPPELCEARFIMEVRALFDYFWTCWSETPTYSYSNAWNSKDNF